MSTIQSNYNPSSFWYQKLPKEVPMQKPHCKPVTMSKRSQKKISFIDTLKSDLQEYKQQNVKLQLKSHSIRKLDFDKLFHPLDTNLEQKFKEMGINKTKNTFTIPKIIFQQQKTTRKKFRSKTTELDQTQNKDKIDCLDFQKYSRSSQLRDERNTQDEYTNCSKFNQNLSNHNVFQKERVQNKREIQLLQRISFFSKINVTLSDQINASKLRQQKLKKQIKTLKEGVSDLLLKVNIPQLQKQKETQNVVQNKLLNDNSIQQKNQFLAITDVNKFRFENSPISIIQLQRSTNKTSAMKTIYVQDEQNSKKSQQVKQFFQTKILQLQKLLSIYTAGRKNSGSQFDQLVKNQILQNQKFKQLLSLKNQQIYSLCQQLIAMRSQVHNIRAEFGIEKIKNISEKKNIQSIWEMQKQNLKGQNNFLLKQIQNLKQKIKSLCEQNKKKDQFIKNNLIAKIDSGSDMKTYIQNFSEGYSKNSSGC